MSNPNNDEHNATEGRQKPHVIAHPPPSRTSDQAKSAPPTKTKSQDQPSIECRLPLKPCTQFEYNCTQYGYTLSFDERRGIAWTGSNCRSALWANSSPAVDPFFWPATW